MQRPPISLATRTIFWLILVGMIVLGLFAFFTSRIGQQALLICCGGLGGLGGGGGLGGRGVGRPR